MVMSLFTDGALNSETVFIKEGKKWQNSMLTNMGVRLIGCGI